MFDANLAILLAVIGVAIAVAAIMRLHAYRSASSGAHRFIDVRRPTLVYFWTPTCAACRYSQTRIIDELAGSFERSVDVVRVNAQERPEEARAFGIFTVPTTVVVGAGGNVHAVNTGLVDGATLSEQIGTLDSLDSTGL